MKTLTNIITLEVLIIITLSLILCFILLLIFCFRISKINRILSQNLFSLQRAIDHRDTLIENTISKMAKDLPLEAHPTTIENRILTNIQELLQQFSLRLNKKIHQDINQAQNIWNDQFSILLKTLGKTEAELNISRDDYFKESWTSISELRQKSQLLFNDMKEDGVFYRMQSLWLLSNINIQQNTNIEALRHTVAALRLYQDSQPTLPLSQKLAWKIVTNLIEISNNIDNSELHSILKKFNLSTNDVLQLCIELDNIESNVELLQKIRFWYNHRI